MNIQNIIGQLKASMNPQQMILSMMTPQQKQLFEGLKNKKMTEKEAQEIADKLNKVGITKEQLIQINECFK